MRFKIYVWNQKGELVQTGVGSNDFDASLLAQWVSAMTTPANKVYLIDTTAKTVTVLR